MEKKNIIHIERTALDALIQSKAEQVAQLRIATAVSQKQREFDREKINILAEKTKLYEQKVFFGKNGEDTTIYKPKGGQFRDDSEEWMVTYADVITLLLTLFVLLFSISRIDLQKFEQLKVSINKNLLNKEEQPALSSLRDNLIRVVATQGMEGKVSLTLDDAGLMVEFPSSVFYESGSADIQPGMQSVLDALISTIKDPKYDGYLIEVEGHTDDRPINTPQFPSNWELSSARATNIIKYLIEKGLDPNNLRAAGFADTRPKVPNIDETGNPLPENQAKNRRVIVYIKSGNR